MLKPSPKRILIAFLMLLTHCYATTYFVRSGASGNGTSWANAWGNVSSIVWSSLGPGDTVCVAGGTYSGGVTYAKSGSSGSPITIKRATSSDPTCGSATTGWNAGYDAQVVMGEVTVSGNYVTIDGMVASGILINVANDASSAFQSSGATSHITIRNVETAGPCPYRTVCHQNGEGAAITSSSWNGSNWSTQDSWLVQNNYFHGTCQGFQMYGASNWIVEHNIFSDIVDDGANGAPCHPNLVYAGGGSGPTTFRYNEFVYWSTEGFLMSAGGPGAIYIYGNVFHDPSSAGYPRVLTANGETNMGPAYLYNNTFANITYETVTGENSPRGSFAAGSVGYNNIFYNSAAPSTTDGITFDYDLSNVSLGETHGQTGTPPFVSSSMHTVAGYHLTGHTTAGLNLGSPYNIDYDGNTRVTWDRGAFEFGARASGPTPPQNLTAAVN